MVLRGERLDKPTYQIIHTLSEGTTAVCYKTRHEIFDRYMVQKTVSLLGLDDTLAYQEPRLLDSLKHANLAEIREAQWDPELREVKAVTFTMPFYERGSLYSVLTGEPRLSIGEAITGAVQILAALAYLHEERGLLHRDIKPGNIFVSEVGGPFVLGDLGSAAPMGEQGQVEARGGTLLYRPPESNGGLYTVQGDLYALGLTLFEMLNGPFGYGSIDLTEVESRLARGERSLPSRLLRNSPQVPAALSRIVNRLIDKDPKRRPRSAADVSRDLLRVDHLDWRELTDSNGDRTWHGYRRDSRPGRADRELMIRADEITRGRDIGKLELIPSWRPVGEERWRGMPAIRSRLHADDDTALREFFRSVEIAVPKR